MKTFLKILIPLLFCFAANSQSVTKLTGDTTVANSNNGATLFQIKNATAYRTGAYLQNYLGGRTQFNYAIDSAWYLGGVLSLRRASHDTLTLAISGGGGGVSSVAAGFGMNFSTITTSGSVAADSFTLATRLRVKKQIDSLAALIGTGGVTSVAAGFGTVFSTITSTGSIIIDSFTIATRLRVKKQIDSLSALLSSYVPTARTLTHSSGFGTTVTGGTQDLSTNRTWSYATDSTSGGLLSWVRGKKIADSLGVIIATKGVGSVTSVAAGYGLNFTTITGSGSVISDTFAMATRARVQKPIDSLDAAIIAGYVPTSRTVAGFALSSNVTLASHTVGFGLSGSAYNGSSAIAWTADSTSGGLLSWVRGKKIIDSLGVVIATKGTGTVTSVASGFGTSFSTITTTGTIVGDSTSGGFESWVRGLKVKDSLVAWGNATFVPLTRTVNGKALSSNITLSLASADFANQGTTTTVLHGNASGNPSFGAIVNADITNSTIDLTTKVTGTLPVANGGTGITSLGTGIATWLGTPSSANLAAAITDETGTGLLVFGTAPTLSNPVVGTQSTGDNTTKAASTAFVTTAISNAISGANPAVAVQAATTANVSGYTYNNGVSGVGATLTQNSAAVVVIDGYTLLLNDRVLFKNQSTAANNGVYVITTLGTGIIPAVFTRATDYNQPSDINNTGAIPVVNGTVNATTSWLLTTQVTTIGTDALTYTQFSYSPTVIALTTNPLSQFSATTSAQLAGVISDETGTGLLVFGTSPVLTTPNLGTPSAITLTSGTGLPISTGVSGLGSGIATFLATPSSANLATAITNETGSGALVFGTSPDFTTAITLGGVTVPTISSTNTFTNKRWTVRVGSTTSSGTPTINTDNTDIYKLTAQSAAITSFTTNLSGTPVDGDALEIQITDDGTARAITFGASFVNGTVSLPTTTVISTTLTVDLKYYSTSSFGNGKWVCVAYY